LAPGRSLGIVNEARDLYDVVPETWDMVRGIDAPLIHLLDGFLDAGRVTHATAAHLLSTCNPERVATFDIDVLHDFRSRRPIMTFDTYHWTAIQMPHLVLDKLTDQTGRPFLLMHGQEPDSRWERMVTATLGICEELGVSRLYTAAGIPLAVPHTRPTGITLHATLQDLAHDNPPLIDRMDVPGQWSAMLELRAGEAGRVAMGYVAHVPHYLSQVQFPQAVKVVLESLMEDTRLRIPLAGLDDEVAENQELIDAEVAGSPETSELVAALEDAFDTAHDRDAPMPSADEIAAEFEKFLADREQDQNP
jgi:hypothetical protein